MEEQAKGQQALNPKASDAAQGVPPLLPSGNIPQLDEIQQDNVVEPKSKAAPDDSEVEVRFEAAPKSKWRQFKKWIGRTTFSDAVMVLLTVFIATSAVASAIAIFLQWREMRSGSNDTKAIAEAAKQQAGSAQRFAESASAISGGMAAAVQNLGAQLKASQDFATLTKQQFAEDQRPYLYLDEQFDSPADPFETTYDGTRIKYNVWIKNYGKSPAVRVRSTAYISVAANPEDDVKWNQPPLPAIGAGICPPNFRFFKSPSTKNPVNRFLYQYHPVTELKGNNTLWAVHILIKYEDQFRNKYTTEICEVMQVNGVQKRCDRHNRLEEQQCLFKLDTLRQSLSMCSVNLGAIAPPLAFISEREGLTLVIE